MVAIYIIDSNENRQNKTKSLNTVLTRSEFYFIWYAYQLLDQQKSTFGWVDCFNFSLPTTRQSIQKPMGEKQKNVQ